MHSNYKEKRQKEELNEKVYEEDKVGKEDKRMRRRRRKSNLKELF